MPTQVEIAAHIDMSERNAREVLKCLAGEFGFSPASEWWKEVSLDDIRVAYIRDLREKAAGRGGEAAGELTRERARLTKEQADKAERENAIEENLKRDVSVLTEVLAQMSVKIAGKLEAIIPRIKREAGDVPREAMGIIERVVIDARNEAFSIELDWEEFDEMEDASRGGEEGGGTSESAAAFASVSVGE